MATHSSVLAWRIPGMGDPGGLLSMGSHGVGHDQSNLAAAAEASPGKMAGETRLRKSHLSGKPSLLLAPVPLLQLELK